MSTAAAATTTDPRFPIGKFRRAEANLTDHAASLAVLAALPEKLRAAVAGLTDAQLDTPYREGGWSVRQLVHHIADSHMNAYIRIRLALTEDWPIIKPSGPNCPTPAPRRSSCPWTFSKASTLAGPLSSVRSPRTSGSVATLIPSTAASPSPKLRLSTTGTPAITSPTFRNYESVAAGSFSLVPERARRGTSFQMPAAASHPAILQSPSAMARIVEAFLADHPHAAIFEDGRLLFDLRLAQCSVSADHGRCLLHLWSSDRNLVRAISAVQPRKETLRLETRRFGQTKPQTLTLVPDPDLRTPTARDTARRRYLHTLEQSLAAHFPDWSPESFRSAMDLEHSFGPAYARGLLTRAQSAWAVIGIGPEEPPATIDGALTLGILWLSLAREHASRRRVVQGLRVVVPSGCATLTRDRMAWLNPSLAQWELYELNSSSGELIPCAVACNGNLDIQLPHAFDPQAALDRAAAAVSHLRSLLQPALLAATEIRPRSATEIAFSLHGLEYARIRHTLIAGSFAHQDQIFFGAGPSETLLDETTEDLFLDLMDRLCNGRHPSGSAGDPLFRLQPERWLESVLRRDLSILGSEFAADSPVYSQFFAEASATRTLLDLVTVTRSGRLAILELKADDDLHLPLQSLDYWARIRALHRAGEIARRGYFPALPGLGRELSPEDPVLCLVAPALHIHPANETVLRHLAPAVPWQLIAIDEHWRTDARVVFRKRSGGSTPS